MYIEAAVMPGKGDIQLTGQLGDVIKESALIALSWVQSHARALGLTPPTATESNGGGGGGGKADPAGGGVSRSSFPGGVYAAPNADAANPTAAAISSS